MDIIHVMNTARSVVIEIKDGGRYYTKKPYRVLLNGEEKLTAEKTIVSLYGLKPDTEYQVEVWDGAEKAGSLTFRTDYEFVTLDVKRFGARGDGEQDDTHHIQAAILACPEHSRVLIPKGVYRITSLFLKSHTRIELAEGAELKLLRSRRNFLFFPDGSRAMTKPTVIIWAAGKEIL